MQHLPRLLVLLLAFALAFARVPATSAQDFTVNLKDTDIQELIQFVAEVTGTTIVVDPAVKGKVKVVSSRPVNRSELYDLFLSILDVHGYTAVRSGEVVRVIQSKDARSASLPVEDASGRVSDEYVTQVIRLDNISAAKLIPVLRPLVPQQAHMAAYAPSNAIIISDTAANIRRMVDIIQRMDRSATAETEVIALTYAVAGEVVDILKKLNDPAQKQAGEAEPEVLLVPDQRTNSVLVNGDEIQRARIRRLIDYLDTPLQQTGNVKVVYLEYAQAKDVSEVLTRVMQNISRLDSPDGKGGRNSEATIEADEGTNSLIITADPNQMAALESVIHRLDIRRAQVLVEAIIVEMEITDGADLGLQWLFANDDGVFGSNVNAGDARARNIAGAILNPDGTEAQPLNTTGDFNVGALAGALAQSPGMTLGWGVVDDNLSMTVILNALRERTNANILSTPSLLTLDNQEAYITVGQNVPFVTGSFTNTGTANGAQNPFQTIERQNVGITLAVKPHINEGDAVVLDIEQEVSSLTGLTGAQAMASDLITNERKVQTKVLAEDQRIVVLGGLIKDDVQDSQQKVPILGDIPLLGRLFRNDSVNVTKTNLLIFIRPTIIRDSAALEGATALKYKEIRNQQLKRREQGLMFIDDADFPVLPEWEAQIQQLEELREESAGEDDGQR
ncbi:type II secretion system secretin GspD [Pseudohaliea rubra]|uniref:General secretion pathway protein D / Type II secretion outermembrane pore forming protein (PulD) n=1 Tax=Pseudohaliea rubra DSM 19751 TaxID=1265313 RepID=A0A095X3A9_9GAMM|nr:type II secretion system secretin GspD [Pseudohaliea rubra]KGE05379.1 General secretion pathway protein D / Type II secretion outermembrane pore forming protein (PulD) [Pseudohaliea rubra DSM 19751]